MNGNLAWFEKAVEHLDAVAAAMQAGAPTFFWAKILRLPESFSESGKSSPSPFSVVCIINTSGSNFW